MVKHASAEEHTGVDTSLKTRMESAAASQKASAWPSGASATAATWLGPLAAILARWRGSCPTSNGAPSAHAHPLTLAACVRGASLQITFRDYRQLYFVTRG